MAIVTAEKIFVDVDDEINFVVEKIFASGKDRVILVVPQNALIISSQVSIKILAKQITGGKKLVVLVSEDEFGLKLAKQAGLVTSNKVSNVTAETWEAAQIALTKSKASAAARKKELLTRRGLLEPENAETMAAALEEDNESEEFAETESEENLDLDSEIEEPELPQTEEEAELETEVLEIPGTDLEEEDMEVPPVPEEKPIRGPIQRVRPQPKLVKVGNLEVFAAGDVSVAATSDKDSDSEEDISNRFGNLFTPRPKGGFTGRDLTRYAPKPEEPKGLAKWFKKRQRRLVVDDLENDLVVDDLENDMGKDRRRKVIIGIAIVTLLALAGLVYAMLFQLNSVDLSITLKTTEIPVSQTITIDAGKTEIDLINLVLPAVVVEQDDINGSDQAEATGAGKAGNKAAGNIEIWNFDTTQEYNLPAGTRLLHTSTNRAYVTKQAVTIPKGKSQNNIIDPGGRDLPVAIEAEQPGVEYNIDISGVSDIPKFSVSNFAQDKLQGQGVDGSITGGTTENFVTPSQEDFDKLKKKIEEDLIKQGAIRLQTVVPSGYRLIAGTEVFTAEETTPVPNVGEKAEKDFTISMNGKITGLAVKEEDLRNAIEQLILANQDNPEGFEVSGLENAVFAEVKRTENTASFLVTSAGNIRSRVDVDTIKKAIAGKTVAEAREYLRSLEDIQHFVLRFNLGFLPEGLQRVPTDLARVSVRFQN